MLVSDAERIQGPNYPETEVFNRMVSMFKSSVSDFVSRAERCCEELAMMVYICHICERVRHAATLTSSLVHKNEFSAHIGFENHSYLNQNLIPT